MNFKETIMSTFQKFFWLLPFLAFFFGYISLQFFVNNNTMQAPNLIGKDILQATKIISPLKINLRIIDEKEVPHAQPGIIVTQNPMPGKVIKAHQSLFIVVTKAQTPIAAPNFIGKTSLEIEQIAHDLTIKNKIYTMPSSYKKDTCFGQIPAAGKVLDTKKMSSYISSGNVNQYIFPDFTGMNQQDVIDFLTPYNVQIHWQEKKDTTYQKKISVNKKYISTIINQKPLAGSFVTPDSTLHLYLETELQYLAI